MQSVPRRIPGRRKDCRAPSPGSGKHKYREPHDTVPGSFRTDKRQCGREKYWRSPPKASEVVHESFEFPASNPAQF